MIKNSILLLFLLCFSSSYGQENNVFDYSGSLKFADYLYKTQEFDLAIQEYKRILFLQPLNKMASIKIMDSYVQSSQYDEGEKYSKLLPDNILLTDTLRTLQGKLFLLTGNFPSYENLITSPCLSPRNKLFLEFSYSMFTKNWDEVATLGNSLNEYEGFEQFKPFVLQTTNIKYKSPELSFVFSAIVPGAGKAYSGYWKDGIFSLLFTGLSAWQSYRGFDKNGATSIYGWVMGGISLSFYGGNLYGSVKAANKRNHENEHAVLDKYKEVFIDSYSNF